MINQSINQSKFYLKSVHFILCVLSLFASLLNYRLVIICMNVLVCVMAAKCRHLFSVLTSGPEA
jgi:hypothetical protein